MAETSDLILFIQTILLLRKKFYHHSAKHFTILLMSIIILSSVTCRYLEVEPSDDGDDINDNRTACGMMDADRQSSIHSWRGIG